MVTGKCNLSVVTPLEIELSVQEKGARTVQAQGVQRALEHPQPTGYRLGALRSNLVACQMQITANTSKYILGSKSKYKSSHNDQKWGFSPSK